MRLTGTLLGLTVAAIACRRPAPGAASDLAAEPACYVFRWPEAAGTWDAPLPNRVRLTFEQAGVNATSANSFRAQLTYHWLANAPSEKSAFSTEPRWRAIDRDSLEITVSDSGVPDPRYAIRGSRTLSGIDGAFGVLSRKGFIALLDFRADSIECDVAEWGRELKPT